MDRAIDIFKLSKLKPSWVINRYALESFEEALMDSSEIEEKFSIVGDAKLHGGLCKILSLIVGKVLEIFPFIEASRPRSKSGIQSLCALHVALDRAKSLLQHCSECSKLYLAITGDSILMKFEKARSSLLDSLTRVENIVPQNIGCQILEIVNELESVVFELDQSEKQIGNDVISLLQKERKGNSSPNCNDELEIFHQAASRLGITSSRAALVERRALKKLIERARAEDDKRKESIVSYLMHLLRKYSKLFRGEISDDTDSQGSAPCSPTILGSLDDISRSGGLGQAFDKHISSPSSFNSKQSGVIFGDLPVPPEELRCSISFQLMYDPVIISSGQTFERACIEKWFNVGHRTCPRTQQKLSHFSLTPNYCVKGLIASWCEQNGVPIPDGPPEPLESDYWRHLLSESEATDRNSCLLKETEIAPFDASSSVQETLEGEMSGGFNDGCCQAFEEDGLQIYESLLAVLYESESMSRKCEAVEQIRLLLKDDEEARIYMGANGFVEALVQFLKSAIEEGDEKAQEIGAMALFNIAVNNNRNKESLLSSDTIPLLQKMISKPSTQQFATAVILNLSFLDEAKPIIGTSHAIPFLVQSLQSDGFHISSCKHDALHTLYNLSTHPSNIQPLLDSNIVNALLSLLTSTPQNEEGSAWTEKVLTVFINIASTQAGKLEMVSTQGLIANLAMILDTGEPSEQEQVVSCLLILCNGDDYCSHTVLQEGVIPALVSISVSGSTKGREKALKLLQLFREQRQREPSIYQQEQLDENSGECAVMPESKPLCKPRAKKLGRTLSSIWKNRHFSVYQC